MAGQAETFSSTKKTEKVVCPLCQGTYEDPKLLPCLHVFCKQCLESHVTVRSAKSLEGLGESAESSNTFHPASEATRNYDEPRHIDPDQTVVVCPLCDTKVDLPVDQIPSCYAPINDMPHLPPPEAGGDKGGDLIGRRVPTGGRFDSIPYTTSRMLSIMGRA